MICLTLPGPSIEENLRYISSHMQDIDMVELRVDFLLANHSVAEIVAHAKQINLPIIATCRLPEDGGVYHGSLAERKDLLTTLIQEGSIGWVDIEEWEDRPYFQSLCSQHGVTLIVSLHDFSGIPHTLESWMREVAQEGCVPKAAVTLHGTKDLATLLAIGASLEFSAILLGMGVYGIPSRMLYKKFGSILTFCSPKGLEVAPGQVTPDYLALCGVHDDENFWKMELFVIIGDPVMHTRSPHLHNRWFRERGIPAHYIPFPVDRIEDFVPLLKALGIRGFSVTIPHKESIVPFLSCKDESVEKIGSCNTVLRESKGLRGVNTDYTGVQEPLREKGFTLNDSAVCILGAGGAARAAAWALKDAGANITIANRTLEKAAALAKEVGASSISLEEVSHHTYDLIVQATSLGMDGSTNPIPDYDWSKGTALFESIYVPEETPLVVVALSYGATLIYGKEMLFAQGVEQSKLFEQALGSA